MIRPYYLPPRPSELSESLYAGLTRYVEERLPTGSFLRAVLCNDLIGAIGRADSESVGDLQALVSFLFNEVRSDCYGSPEVVDRWLAGREVAQ